MDQIRHLYARAGFGLSPGEWLERRQLSVTQSVDHLFEATATAAPIAFLEPETDADADRQAMRKLQRQLVGQHATEWLLRMADPEESDLLEKVSLFWHGHFACRSVFGKLAVDQLNTIRQHALGPFRDLCVGIARNPAMIRYLNNQQNRKNSPNENFARELMELFTIGRGNYSEQDIKESARAFTGWSSNLQGNFVFRRGQHDFGEKTFFGRSGRFDGEDIIDILLEQRTTADFLVRKFWRYFVSTTYDEGIIAELSRFYYDSGYHTGQLLRRIFTADWFYEDRFQRCQIKSPVVLIANMIRTLDVQLSDDNAYLFVLRALGQQLFNPPNVAGWPGGRAWIDNATLMTRLNLGATVLTDREIDLRFRQAPEETLRPDRNARRLQASVTLQPFVDWLDGMNIEAAYQELCRYLIGDLPRLQSEQAAGLGDDPDGMERARRLLLVITSSPEYQLC